MPLPEPVQGLVVHYSYLWRSEQERDRQEGVKDRPCVIILVTVTDGSDRIVTVLPMTHSPPRDPRDAVEVPQATKRRLGLDAARSWIVLTEANRFIWPGPDLRPSTPGDAASAALGVLPYGLMDEIRRKFVDLLKEHHVRAVGRTE